MGSCDGSALHSLLPSRGGRPPQLCFCFCRITGAGSWPSRTCSVYMIGIWCLIRMLYFSWVLLLRKHLCVWFLYLVSSHCFRSRLSHVLTPHLALFIPPPVRHAHTDTHLVGEEKNPKFELPGFIFRDNLSPCITRIRPQQHFASSRPGNTIMAKCTERSELVFC